ncbi:MAG: sigma-70 family RNA polymerase sigma factor [Myxococcaceae bacterium]
MGLPKAQHLNAVTEALESELAALIAGVQRRDRKAIGHLFDRFEGEVNRIVWALLGADPEHDDVVHHAFAEMIENIGQVTRPIALRGWVRAIAVNQVRKTIRGRRWRRLFGSAEEGLERFDALAPDEARLETIRRVYRVLDTLSPELRTALVLRHLEGYELSELAEALSCSLATAKRWLARAEDLFSKRHGPWPKGSTT